MSVIAVAAWLLALMLSLPGLVFTTECLAGLSRQRRRTVPGEAPPYAVLVPAHDEAAGIVPTLGAIGAQLRPGDRLVVVADNCTDATARIALRAGAEVVERFDAARRGKGFALAAGRDYIAGAPPAVVIVIDADCQPAIGALARLAGEAARCGGAVQGAYLLAPPADPPPMVELSCFAFLVRNLVRQRGLDRLGAPALLQGTGMAFPWPLFAQAPLANPSLVEDLALGLDLALAGKDVRFVEAATVMSAAGSRSATVTQRTRWEHGMLETTRRYLPRLVGAALCGRPRLLLLAFDLLVPPLALLGVLLSGGAAVGLALGILVGFGPFVSMVGAAALLALTVVLVWAQTGRRLLPLSTLLRVPQYLVWKLPIYARLFAGRQRLWVRTERGA